MINYYQDGPCGDCPFAFTCNLDNTICVSYEAWLIVLDFIKKVRE